MSHRGHTAPPRSYHRLPAHTESHLPARADPLVLCSPVPRPVMRSSSSQVVRPSTSFSISARPSTAALHRGHPAPRGLSLASAMRTARTGALERPWLAAPPARGILRFSELSELSRFSGLSGRGPRPTPRRVRFDEASIRLSGGGGGGGGLDTARGSLALDVSLRRPRGLVDPPAAAATQRLRRAPAWGEDSAWFAEQFSLAPQHPPHPRPQSPTSSAFLTSLSVEERRMLRELVCVNQRKLLGRDNGGSPGVPPCHMKTVWQPTASRTPIRSPVLSPASEGVGFGIGPMQGRRYTGGQ